MKKYPAYKDSGIEWLGEIPEHWIILQMRYLTKSISNGTTQTQIEDESEFRVTRIETISKGLIDLQKTGYIEYSQNIENFRINKGDILLSHINSFEMVGNCAQYTFDTTLYHGMNLLRLQPNNLIKSRYLYWLYKTHLLNNKLKSYCKHAINQVSIPISAIKHVRAFLPPTPEQTTIANFLDHKTQQIDDLIAKKEQLIELLKEERTATINHAVTKGLDPNVPMKDSGIEWLGEIPRHWEVKSLKYCVEKIGSGVTPRGGSEVYMREGVPLIRSQNVTFECVDLSNVAYISQEIHNSMKNSKVLPNDILLNITGASIGRCNCFTLNIEANVNQHVCIIRPKIYNSSKFLNYILQSSYGQILIHSNITGSGREGLNFENIGKFKMILPDIEEQNNIVKFIDHTINNIIHTSNNLTKQINLLREYKTALINEAVTGKIDVRDYNINHVTI